MLTVAGYWLAAAAATWTLFVLASLALDGRVIWSSWLKLWMVLTLLLGPVGTLLAVRFVAGLVRFTLRRRRLEEGTEAPGSPPSLVRSPCS